MTPTDTEINAAITLLRSRGFTVTQPHADEWISPVDLWRKHGTGTLAAWRDRLHHPRCPHYERKPGRLTMLRPTPELLAFLRRPAQPGKRLQ